MHNIFKNTEVRRLTVDGTNYVKAAGTTDTLTGTAIDTLNYADVGLAVALGAVVDGGTCTIKLQQSSDDGSADAYSDIAGSSHTIGDTDDNKVHMWDLFRPGKRYIKIIIIRATQNLTVDGCYAFLTLPSNAPVTQGATIVSTTFMNTPAEGTA